MKTEILRLYEEDGEPPVIELRMEYFWFLNFRRKDNMVYLYIAGGIIPNETGMQAVGPNGWTLVE